MSGLLFLVAQCGVLAVIFWSVKHDSTTNTPQCGLFALRREPGERATPRQGKDGRKSAVQ